jgi:hypothetical protein
VLVSCLRCVETASSLDVHSPTSRIIAGHTPSDQPKNIMYAQVDFVEQGPEGPVLCILVSYPVVTGRHRRIASRKFLYICKLDSEAVEREETYVD